MFPLILYGGTKWKTNFPNVGQIWLGVGNCGRRNANIYYNTCSDMKAQQLGDWKNVIFHHSMERIPVAPFLGWNLNFLELTVVCWKYSAFSFDKNVMFLWNCCILLHIRFVLYWPLYRRHPNTHSDYCGTPVVIMLWKRGGRGETSGCIQWEQKVFWSIEAFKLYHVLLVKNISSELQSSVSACPLRYTDYSKW